ncbi:MAG: clostripain-related cysteine peptidase [Armatimonadota bacterium]|nr:clostripain-related cysteine peptidase [Armatimonadota bacterium]
MTNKKIISAIYATLLIAISITGCGSGSRHIDSTVKWTFLVYMCADNDLERYALQDLNELETIGSNKNVSVIVQIDRSPGFDTSDGNWTTTRRYYVTRDSDTSRIGSVLLEDLGELDMSSESVLSDFIHWGTANYPADYYVLVLWDHGRGWQTRAQTLALERPIKAINYDQSSMKEMNLDQLHSALASDPKLDIVLFDACLMGMLEVAYAIDDNAEIMVASEDNIPASGQPYHLLLSTLQSKPDMTPFEFGTVIVNSYVGYYINNTSGPLTASAIKLSSIRELANAVDNLGTAILQNLNSERSIVRDVQQKVQYFDSEKMFYDDYKDIYDFASLLSTQAATVEVRSAASSVTNAVKNIIIAERHAGNQVANAHGISIYVPAPGTLSAKYCQISFAQNTSWDEFLMQY